MRKILWLVVGTCIVTTAIAAYFGPAHLYLTVVVPLLTETSPSVVDFGLLGLGLDLCLVAALLGFGRRLLQRRQAALVPVRSVKM